MGLLDKVPGLSNLAEKASSAIPRSTSSFSTAGIEGKANGEIHGGVHAQSGARKVDARGKWWDDEDGLSPLGVGLRALQTFFPFINLCIYIALAAWQSQWKVGVSGLVGLALAVNIEALLHGGVIFSTLLLADKFPFLRPLERALKQVRIAVIINAFQSLLHLLLAIVTTVSANVGGCKDPSKDPHADTEGLTDALSGFCRNKRAGAAFFWLNTFAWIGSLTLTFLVFYRIRRHPTSGGFIPPGSQFPADADEEAAFGRPSYDFGSGAAGGRYAPTATGEGEGPFADSMGGVHAGGYRPSHDYAEGGERLFNEDGLSGQGYDQGLGMGRRDPFEDPQDGGYGGGGPGRYGGNDDPYEAIRKSMDVNRQPY
ncbi:hypothetical protein JCM11251_007750 [Rhodosporidiobolus azoricus]